MSCFEPFFSYFGQQTSEKSVLIFLINGSNKFDNICDPNKSFTVTLFF